MSQTRSKTNIQNTTCSQDDEIIQFREKRSEISRSDLLQTSLPSKNEEEACEETNLVTRLKEIDETLEKGLKFFKSYNWIMIILIGLSFTFPVIVSLVDMNFRVIFYICSLCFLFQSQHILNLLAIRRKNFIYAKCSVILTLIKTIITLIIMWNFRLSLEYFSRSLRHLFVDDKHLYQLYWVTFVISSLSFLLQVNITLPRSFMLEKLLLERSETQRKMSLKNVTNNGYILMGI